MNGKSQDQKQVDAQFKTKNNRLAKFNELSRQVWPEMLVWQNENGWHNFRARFMSVDVRPQASCAEFTEFFHLD